MNTATHLKVELIVDANERAASRGCLEGPGHVDVEEVRAAFRGQPQVPAEYRQSSHRKPGLRTQPGQHN
eukprot:scaffold326936_cov25-Prasinocladus_malaysianus.AAC.1